MSVDISVIIPTYNEKENIGNIVDIISQEVPLLKEITIVDDDSPDMTWRVAEELSSQDNRIRLIRRLNKKGLPGAIWEGILNSQGKIVLWLDADFLSLPFTLTSLLEQIDGYDIIVASRYVKGGRDNRKEKMRVLTSRIFNKAARFILQTRTQDLTSGYIIARREVFNTLHIGGLYGEYCIKFLYQAEKRKMKIKELPYTCLSRAGGNSKTCGNIFVFLKYCLIYIFTVFKLRLVGNEL
jgi:dolichol-phosphate mannosyltransferase